VTIALVFHSFFSDQSLYSFCNNCYR